MRVAASSASMIAAFSRRNRATSASWRLSDCTSGAALSDSSATARERAAAAALLARGALDQAARTCARRRGTAARRPARRARASTTARTARRRRRGSARRALKPSPSAESRKRSIAATSPVSRASRSPTRRRPSWSGLSDCTCAKTCVRRSSRKRSPTQVATYSSANDASAPAQREAEVGGGDRHSAASSRGHEHVVDDELEEVDLDRVDRRDDQRAGPGRARSSAR